MSDTDDERRVNRREFLKYSAAASAAAGAWYGITTLTDARAQVQAEALENGGGTSGSPYFYHEE